MKPVCVSCQRFFSPKKMGLPFIEAMPMENHAKPGTAEPEKWKPYKLWSGDEWECRGCGARIVVGTGMSAIAEHWEKDFKRLVETYGVTITVNDC